MAARIDRKITRVEVVSPPPAETRAVAPPPMQEMHESVARPELLLGYLLVGLACAVTGYVLVHSFWWLVRHHEDPERPAHPIRPLRRARLREQDSQT